MKLDTFYNTDYPIKCAKFISNEFIILAGFNSIELYNFQLELSIIKLEQNLPVASMDFADNTIIIGCNKGVVF